MDTIYMITLYIGLLTGAVYLLLSFVAVVLEPTHNPREPPLISSPIPLIGHIIGLARHGPRYFVTTSARTGSPIYTLNVFSGKIYVVTAPHLVNAVSKNTKTLSFNPFIAEVAIRVTHCSQDARKIIERNIDGSEGKESYVIEIHDNSVTTLGPGPDMQQITLSVVRAAWQQFLKPIEDSQSDDRVSLLAWIRYMVTFCSGKALYGPSNPAVYDDGKDFWDYQAGMNTLLVDVLPAFTARKAHLARERLGNKLARYLESDVENGASKFIQNRYRIARKHGFSHMDAARAEVGNMIGIMVNTVPALFYMLCHIFADAELLAQLRQEITTNALCHKSEQALLDISALRSQCPLLHSTLQEVLRVYQQGATVRMVVDDTLLAGQYLLKKGAVLQMPNSVIHRDPTIWGSTTFSSRRFVSAKTESTDVKTTAEPQSTTAAGSYRPWGGGSTVCPGRHFANAEILGLAALIIWRFDAVPADGKPWVIPESKQASVVEAVFPPVRDVEVIIKKRDTLLPKDWDVVFD